MTHPRRRVVVTGAAGRIGRAITPLLPSNWELQLTDRMPANGIGTLNVNDPDACRLAFAAADAVVHLAAVPDPSAPWETLMRPNVMGGVVRRRRSRRR